MRMWFFGLILACACLAPSAYAAETLTYEGKVIAQVERKVHAPFPIIVDQLLASIGQDVQAGQRVLEYHLEPGVARSLQYELLSSGDDQGDNMMKAQLEQDIIEARAKMQTAGELASKGLGSAAEAKRASLHHSLLQQRRNSLEQRRKASQAAYKLRLKELEDYFGSPLKAGQPLPAQLFLTAPISATVIDISPQARPLGTLEANAAAMTLAVLNPIQVQIQVHESEIPRMYVGMPVSVEAVNLSDQKMPGQISMLSLQAVDPAIAVPSFYNVYIDVNNSGYALKPGYKVLVHVDLAEK